MDLSSALKNMAKRVDCADLRFMITAVTIQREIGGNLSDIFDRLGDLVRKRFALIRATSSLTAQGRLSGVVLTVLPIALGAFLFITNPDYINVLLEDPAGIKIVIGAGILQVLGFLCIRKISNIEAL